MAFTDALHQHGSGPNLVNYLRPILILFILIVKLYTAFLICI